MNCPDGGTCHHFCDRLDERDWDGHPCWRVHNAGPLSGVYLYDRWPAELKETTMAGQPSNPYRGHLHTDYVPLTGYGPRTNRLNVFFDGTNYEFIDESLGGRAPTNHPSMPAALNYVRRHRAQIEADREATMTKSNRPATVGERVDITDVNMSSHGAWGRIVEIAVPNRVRVDLYEQHVDVLWFPTSSVTVMLDTEKRTPPVKPEHIIDSADLPAPQRAASFVIGDRVKYVAPEAAIGMIGARGTVVKIVGLYINVQWDGNKTVGTYFANDLEHLPTGTIDTTIDANAWLINQMATITKEHEELTSGLVRVDRYHREAAHNLITELARIGYTITKAQR